MTSHIVVMPRSKTKTPLNRSQIMSRIRGKDTGPEIAFRKALRARGIGYRLHAKDLSGRPDVVMRGRRIAIFVHGCFWHRHPGCASAGTPRTRTDFWNAKFAANEARDRRNIEALRSAGWRAEVVWECEVRRDDDLRLAVEAVADMLGRRPSVP